MSTLASLRFRLSSFGAAVAEAQPTTTDVGNQVTLDGSQSSDLDGDALTYSWILATPSGSSAALSDASAEQPTFTPDVAGDCTATLEVSDSEATDRDDATNTAETSAAEISSNVTEDRTLMPDRSYVVTSTICVENSSTLTIEDGVQIEFESGTGLKVCGDGSALVANGTASNGILMTGTTEQAGFWQGVGIKSANQNNELSGVTIEYVESKNLYTFVSGTGVLQLKGSTAVTIANTTVRNNAEYGLTAETGVDLSGFSNNTFAGNEKEAMNIAASSMGAIDEDSYFGSPVRVSSGSISNETLSIADLNAPYRISGVRTIDSGSDVTVKPGAVFEFESESGLNVDGDAAAFKAVGAEADSIRFTGVTKQKGAWQGLGIRADSVSNELDYVVEHSGGNNIYTFSDEANIQVRGQLTLTNARIVDSEGYGLASSDGASAISESNNTFRRNANGARNY